MSELNGSALRPGREQPRQTNAVRLSDLKRFIAAIKVNSETQCWMWTAGKSRQGYGKFAVGGRRVNGGQDWWAHRWAYAVFVGPIPEGMTVHHECGNTSCCNPQHLRIVTREGNVAESNGRRGRADGE